MSVDAKFRAGINSKLVVAPAAACLKWNSEPSGKVRLVFTYWGGVEKKLPKELRPTGGDKLTPHLMADSAAHAKQLLAAIKAWLLEKHPDLTQKKKKALTRFISGDDAYWVSLYPEQERSFALEAIYEHYALPWTICGDPKNASVLWHGCSSEVRVRITDGEVRFEIDDQYAEHVGKPQKLGKLTFDDGLLAAISLDTTFAELPDRTAMTLAGLRSLAGKKPAVIKGKKGDVGDAFAAKIAPGTYAVEAGPDVAAKLRWLTLKRV